MRRFLGLWLAGVALLVGLVAAFNALVDPYGVLGAPRLPGINAEKFAAADRPRLTKSYLVDHAGIQTIVLGASNVDVAFNPDSPAFPPEDRPVFNLAIDGSLPRTLADYLRHALATNHPKLILVGLTLEDAMIMPANRLSAADAAVYDYAQRLHTRRDGTANPGYRQAVLADIVFATLSTRALADSVLTLARQGRTDLNLQTPAGHNTGGSFQRWTAQDGVAALVTNKDLDKANNFVRWAPDPRTEIEPLAEIVALSRKAGARLIFFIQPTYVDELEMIDHAGLMPAWRKWKQDVTHAIFAASGDDPATLWDFSGYTPYTTEPLPGPHDAARGLTWFWEPIHYRQALADAMIRRMLGTGGPADLGVQITPATLPAQLAAGDRAQTEWQAAHPEDMRRVARIFDSVQADFCSIQPGGCKPARPQTISSK